MSSSINLSQLPAPDVVETLDYETLLAERKAALIALYPADEQAAVAATLALESEPIVKILQENAYREIVLRKRINEAAQAVMLAYAEGDDLDNIGANFGVERLLVDAGDASAVPPIAATHELDPEYRKRIVLSRDGHSTAGSRESYIYWGLSADGAVKDIAATSPAPGVVTIYVLSRNGSGEAPLDLLQIVGAKLSAEDIRPMNDNLIVQSASIVPYQIEAALEIYPGPDTTVVRDSAIAAARTYAETQHRIGYDVTLSGIYAALHQPGVIRVHLNSPLADVVIGEGQASYCTAIQVTATGGVNV